MKRFFFNPANSFENARTGQLNLKDLVNNSSVSFPTPFPLLTTKSGQVAFLTPDLLNLLPPSLINYSFDNILQDYEKSVPAHYGYGSDIPCFTSFHNSLDHLSPSSFQHLAGDNFVSITTDQGLRKFNLEDISAIITETHFPWITPPYDSPPIEYLGQKRLVKSCTRTLKYLDSVLELKKEFQQIAGVSVGGTDLNLRSYFAKELNSRDIFGVVIEGLGIGENLESRTSTISAIIASIPESQPRIMTHTNTLSDVFHAIENGVDIVQSTYPIQLAEKGYAFNIDGKILLWDKKYERDQRKIDNGCECYACKNHTRAYIHHLLQTHELLGSILLAHHNLNAYFELFKLIRQSIEDGTLTTLKNKVLSYYDLNLILISMKILFFATALISLVQLKCPDIYIQEEDLAEVERFLRKAFLHTKVALSDLEDYDPELNPDTARDKFFNYEEYKLLVQSTTEFIFALKDHNIDTKDEATALMLQMLQYEEKSQQSAKNFLVSQGEYKNTRRKIFLSNISKSKFLIETVFQHHLKETPRDLRTKFNEIYRNLEDFCGIII